MLTETTITKLRQMHLSVMAAALRDQLDDPQMQNLPFEDRIGLLVDAEWNARKNNHLLRLIRQATFADTEACLENVEYLADRNLHREELLRFGSCNYIREHRNILLLGATGSGKTYLACALGMAAARQFLPVKYIRLPDLLVDLSIARGNGTIRKLLNQYKKYALLILDEWLLFPLKETECRDLLEIMEARYKRASTILCSQFDVPGWRDKLADPMDSRVHRKSFNEGRNRLSKPLFYDGKDLLNASGCVLHQKNPDQEYRKRRCLEIYGKLI